MSDLTEAIERIRRKYPPQREKPRPTDYELRMQYQESESFRTYVNKYCIKHDKSLDEAIRDMIVIEVAKEVQE